MVAQGQEIRWIKGGKEGTLSMPEAHSGHKEMSLSGMAAGVREED